MLIFFSPEGKAVFKQKPKLAELNIDLEADIPLTKSWLLPVLSGEYVPAFALSVTCAMCLTHGVKVIP